MTAPHAYLISGLTVASQMELPGAIPHVGDRAPEVVIRLAPVPHALEGATEQGPNWDLSGDRLLLRVPNLARYLITAGRSIDVELELGATAHEASATEATKAKGGVRTGRA